MRPALILSLLVVFVAGCGGGGDNSTSKEDFKKDFAPVDSELKAEGQEVAQQFQTAEGKSDAALATAFDKIATRLNASLDKLAKVEPTDELKADFDQLQKQFQQVHKDIAKIASTARAHDPAGAKAATEQAVSDSAAIKTTANKIRKSLGLPVSP